VPFNHLLANLYRNGEDSMGMHADAEPELGVDPVVGTLSFGATRRLRIVPRKGIAATPREFQLQSGDLFVMGGTCQRFFLHGIPRAKAASRDDQVGERISLTMRELKRAPAMTT
jgi:alkylated DNA repair dioxygenase AlkB